MPILVCTNHDAREYNTAARKALIHGQHTLKELRLWKTFSVLSQNTESFLRSIENAFRHFGGVPERLCPDNLKAAVNKADWYEPELNPKLRDFAAHYGTVILHSRPYTPTDKGKVEAAPSNTSVLRHFQWEVVFLISEVCPRRSRSY